MAALISVSLLWVTDDVYVKSWTSNQGVACIDGTDPLGCFGPEGASVTFEICATCTPSVSVEEVQFDCENSYALEPMNTTCVYHGNPASPGGACPAGYIYDPVGDICVKVGVPSLECPKGYWYDADKDCCVATYAEPSPDSPGSSASYLPCPPGFGNVQLIVQALHRTCSMQFVPTTSIVPKWKIVLPGHFNVGQCEISSEPKSGCCNPGSYLDKSSCEAAKCKWEPGDQQVVHGPCVLFPEI